MQLKEQQSFKGTEGFEVIGDFKNDATDDSSNCGKWTINQNLKYIIFLYKNKSKFSSRLKRRKIRLFEKMSEFIKTRTPTQCRTHHQKYETKFGDTKTIIEIYKQQVGVKKFKKFVKTLDFEKEQSNKSKQSSLYLLQDKNSVPVNKKDRVEIGVQTDFIESPITFVTLWPGQLNSLSFLSLICQ